MSTLHAPRLLPATIAALAALLAMKSISLVRAALPDKPQTMLMARATAAAQHNAPTAARETAPRPAVSAPDSEPKPVSPAERKVLLQLRKRRQRLDAREVALTARESVLAAAEKRLDERVKELSALQKKLEALQAKRKQREELGWRGLVKVYEVMKPRDAAAIFNKLQMKVLIPVLHRMKDRNAAPILAAMDPQKARDVTAALAKLQTDHDTAAGMPGG